MVIITADVFSPTLDHCEGNPSLKPVLWSLCSSIGGIMALVLPTEPAPGYISPIPIKQSTDYQPPTQFNPIETQ